MNNLHVQNLDICIETFGLLKPILFNSGFSLLVLLGLEKNDDQRISLSCRVYRTENASGARALVVRER